MKKNISCAQQTSNSEVDLISNFTEFFHNVALCCTVGCFAFRNPRNNLVEAILKEEKESKEVSKGSYNEISSNDVNLDLENQTPETSNKPENSEQSKIKKYKWSLVIAVLVLVLIITLAVTLSDNEKSSKSNGVTDDDLDRGHSNQFPEPSLLPTPLPTHEPTPYI